MTVNDRQKKAIKEYLERTKKNIDWTIENLDMFEHTTNDLNEIFGQVFKLCGDAGEIRMASIDTKLL